MQSLLTKYGKVATYSCDSLTQAPHTSCVTPHLRHKSLTNRVGSAVIALDMGHESLQATSIYVYADLAINEHPSAYGPCGRHGKS
jgi:hypothetical protein